MRPTFCPTATEDKWPQLRDKSIDDEWNTSGLYFPLQKRTMTAHQPNVFAYSAVPFVNSLMISSDNHETDPGGRQSTQTNQLLAYKSIEHRNLPCGSFQAIVDMLGILSLAALSLHLHPNKHTHTHTYSIKGENLMPDLNALLLCVPRAQCWLRPNPCILRIKMLREEWLVVRWPAPTPGLGRYSRFSLS